MVEMDWIKQYKEERMERGKQIEALGIEERENFLYDYPIETIPNLTIEQYALGNNSFAHKLIYGLPNITSPGNVRPNISEIYTTKDEPLKILLSKSCQKNFGSNKERAFILLKKEIVNFLEDIAQKNYDNFENYKINSIIKNMLMIVYFYDRFVPVRINGTMNDCLNRVSIPFGEKEPMIDKNLRLVEWKKTVPKLANWSNQMVLDFCLWLKRKDITTNKEELCNDAIIEEAQKIEEISSLNVEGESKEAIIDARVNQGIFRDLLLKRYSKCCLCGVENHTLLTASHIKPWTESDPKEKLDVDNGFLMCPNHDRVFDKGYISFDDEGKIIISDRLTENDRLFLNVDSRMSIELTENNKRYLEFHRENIFNS